MRRVRTRAGKPDARLNGHIMNALHRIVRACLLVLPVFCALRGGVALAALDDWAQTKAADVTVKTDDTVHKVGDEIARLDALRDKLMSRVHEKLRANDFNLAEELKAMAKLDRYSSRLADLVDLQQPGADPAVAGWLRANGAAIGAWREVYTGAGPFADNTRVAELKALQTKLGIAFDGTLGREMRNLIRAGDSDTAREELEATARRVRAASGLISDKTGLDTLGVITSPCAVPAGKPVTAVVALALGTGSGLASVQVILELGVTGPKGFSIGTLKKQLAPGTSIGTGTYFTIPTDDLPEGIYTASLSATDTFGHSMTAKDTFEVRRKGDVAVQPPVGPGGGGAGIAALQGTWQVVSIDGNADPKKIGNVTIRFEGDKMIRTVNGTPLPQVSYGGDPSRSPSPIDLKGGQFGPSLGLYELKGDTLSICFGPDATAEKPSVRPGSMNGGGFLMVLKRVGGK
jgi:uncharacterized protein (TIGR03067 family)